VLLVRHLDRVGGHGQVPIDEIYPLSGVHANAVNTERLLPRSFIASCPPPYGRLEIALLLAVTALSFHRSRSSSQSGTPRVRPGSMRS